MKYLLTLVVALCAMSTFAADNSGPGSAGPHVLEPFSGFHNDPGGYNADNKTETDDSQPDTRDEKPGSGNGETTENPDLTTKSKSFSVKDRVRAWLHGLFEGWPLG